MTPASGAIQSIQVLRAVAALCVLFGHLQQHVVGLARGAGQAREPWLSWAGGFGVDLFFCISGFIIVLSARKVMGQQGAGMDFMVRRLIRVVPLYWLATCAYLPIFLLGSSTAGRDWLWPWLASLAFIPYPVFGDWASPYPLLTLGWTLNYEMWFYLSMALILTLARRHVVMWVALWMGGLVALGTWLDPDQRQLFFWSRPIVLEFVAGAALGMAHARGGVKLPWAAAGGLVSLATAWVVVDPFGLMSASGPTPNDWVRLAAWGGPAWLILFAAVASPAFNSVASHLLAKPLVRLGDASYSLYLLHPFVLIVSGKLWMASSLHLLLPWWCLACVAVALTWLVARLSHRWIELRASTWLGRLGLARRWMVTPKAEGAVQA